MSSDIIARERAASQGPAPAEPGACRNGTLHILRDAAYDHLDPQRSYTLQSMALGHLLFRTLTMFREDEVGARVLVGDLAETPGRDAQGDCRAWEFILKRGVLFEDGREVTAGDVAYGIARSFAPEISDGPIYLRKWLGENGAYQGPYANGSTEVPGLEVTDRYTLVFRFREPHPDLPFVVALPITAPVPRDADSGVDYDQSPVASGPYRIVEHVPGERLVLVRNPYWDPATDPVRHDHPDRIEVEMGVESGVQNLRVRAGQESDACAVAENNAPQAVAAELVADPSLRGRLRRLATPLIWYLAINTDRVTDVNVRRAIAYAVDRTATRAAMMGEAQGELVHTILPAATIGHRDYRDPYPGGPHGDPRAAAELLAGRTPTLRILSRDGGYFLAGCRAVGESLSRAGFRIELVEIDRPSHNAAVKTRGNPYDLYMMGLAADWPGASTLLGTFDGQSIGASGNDNFSYLADPAIDAEIDRISRLPARKAAAEWAALDERIMRDHVPVVPLFSYVHLALHGSRVGGVFTSTFLGTPIYYNAYVTDPEE
jgi:peptide/nickel transport system substrate-binding protein